jgi:hypothetical protein
MEVGQGTNWGYSAKRKKKCYEIITTGEKLFSVSLISQTKNHLSENPVF